MENAIILFDGVCNLCNSSVQRIIANDSKDYFLFASQQSEFAKKKLNEFNLNSEHLSSVILIENNKIYTKSTAALRIARRMDGAYFLLYVFIVIPKFIRDWVYNYIAKNRYKWFGKQDSCWIPTPDLKSKFLA